MRAFLIGAGVLVGAFTVGLVITLFNPARPRLENIVLDVTALGSRPDGCARVHEFLCGESQRNADGRTAVLSDDEAERRAHELLEGIRGSFPQASKPELDHKLVSAIYTPERRGRVLAAYRRVKKAMSVYIATQPDSVFTKREKTHLIRQLDRVSLELPPPAELYADEADLFLKSDVFYERGVGNKLRLRIGGAFLLGVESRFNLVFTLAHELAHAIDPCEIRIARMSIPSYDRLTACFLKQGLIAMRPTRRECGRGDQLSETFADWFAAQITADALAEHALAREAGEESLNTALVDSVRDLCEDPEGRFVADTEHHPSPQVRIERIFGEHPTIQSLLGCKPPRQNPTPYCTL